MNDFENESSRNTGRTKPKSRLAQEARRWGFGMVAIGAACVVLPFIGFEVRGLGPRGTWIVAAIVGI